MGAVFLQNTYLALMEGASAAGCNLFFYILFNVLDISHILVELKGEHVVNSVCRTLVGFAESIGLRKSHT